MCFREGSSRGDYTDSIAVWHSNRSTRHQAFFRTRVRHEVAASGLGRSLLVASQHAGTLRYRARGEWVDDRHAAVVLPRIQVFTVDGGAAHPLRSGTPAAARLLPVRVRA